MDEQVNNVENYDTDDAAYEEEVADGNCLGGKIFGGLMTAAFIGGGALVYKNKDAIKAKVEAIKERKRAKKVQKCLDKLGKLGYHPDDEANTEE